MGNLLQALRKTEGKDLLEKWVRERCRWSVFSLAPVHCTSSFSMDGILQPHGLDSGAFDKLETISDISRKILPRGFLRGVGLAYVNDRLTAAALISFSMFPWCGAYSSFQQWGKH